MALRETTLADYQRRLLRAQQQVTERLDDPIDPLALARAAHLSVHHFHRIFKAQMGETVMQYVRRLRLERAARRLLHSPCGNVRLIDLALEAGYESHEAFTRAFIQRFGTPPSQFRGPDRLERLAACTPEPAREPSVTVRVETFPSLRVAYMRSRGSYSRVGETWQRMLAWAAPRGLLAGPSLYGLCPDDPDVTAEALLRFDACVSVGPDFAEEDVAVTQIPGGTYAVGVHVGPYDRLHETYLDVIGRWFPISGREPAVDAIVEHYLNDPSCTAPSSLRTEVRVRIAE